MKSTQDLSSTIQQDFLAHSENTMGAELGANVGLVLLNLASHFSGNSLEDAFGQELISSKQVDAYLAALSEKICEQDDETQKAWVHVQAKLEEDVDTLDRITVYVNGEEQERCFDLKTTLALVYAALTDRDAYWNVEKKRLSARAEQKEINEAQDDFDDRYAKDEEDRLSTLWSCFQALQNKRICHTGIRNELVMTLNGVYPKVWLIESLDAFIHDFIVEHILKQIDSQKADPTLYHKIILAEMSEERLESLSKALEESKSELREAIEKELVEHGTNPKNCSDKIDSYLAAQEEVHLSFEDTALMSSLSFLLKPSFKEDKHLLVVKNWINSEFEFGNELHAAQVIDFAKVQKCLALFKKHQAALRGWNEDLINVDQLGQLNKELEAYNESCIQMSSPQQASDELDFARQHFEKACDVFKRDSQYDWIENIFIQWVLGNQQTQSQLYSKLYDSTMQEKYLVTANYLESQFAQTGEEIEIPPYLINRIFLHAIVVHPEKWGPVFPKYLTEVYKFVSQELSKEMGYGAQALKRDSYTQALMHQLEYLQDYYQYTQDGQNEPDKWIDSYIPMKQLVQTINELNKVISHLSLTQIPAFLGSLGDELLKSIISDCVELGWVLWPLSEPKKQVVIDFLGHEFLKALIKENGHLISVLQHLSAAQKEAFMDYLGAEFLKPMIKNRGQLCWLLTHLSEAQIPAFIGSWRDKLEVIIPRFIDLVSVVRGLSTTKIPAFIDSLDYRFLNSKIKDSKLLDQLLGALLSEAQKTAFMDHYNKTKLQLIIKGFCNDPANAKDDGLVKVRAIINNPDLKLHDKINQVITLAEQKKTECDYIRCYHFFHQEIQKSPKVEGFYRSLAALKTGTQEAIDSFLDTYPLDEPGQSVVGTVQVGG